MPTYSFKCLNCGHELDVEHGMHDLHPTQCPKCKMGILHRRFYTQNVIYKRAGFRATDKRLEIHPDNYDPDVD